jgi:pyruvate dehydrogenase E2 component (dihydrolipoamide acetyltransferase)
MRKAVVRTVTQSAAVPQYAMVVEADTTAVREVRAEIQGALPGASVIDLLHLALARTLPQHRLLNASFTGEEIILHGSVNLAVIVEVPDGMVAPVLREADVLSISQLVNRRRELIERARAGTLDIAALEAPTFTISNLGSFGVHSFTAMLLPPQSAVLAVGAIGPDAMWRLTLTVDHRVVDGAIAARFLREVADRVADPTWLRTTIQEEVA